MSQVEGRYGSAEWDDVRTKFSASLMVDTNLTSLAENVGTQSWPIEGEAETPSKYIDFTMDELRMMPEFHNRPERVDLLIDILKETIAFDDPFQDMVSHVETAAQSEDAIKKNLNHREIPLDYPIENTHLSSDTKDFCEAENIRTLGEFVHFSQTMSQSIIVGGDFRTMLNCMAHIDEEGLAKFLPYRPGSKGLHLAEAIELVLNELSREQMLGLMRRYGMEIPGKDMEASSKVSNEDLLKLEKKVLNRIKKELDYFTGERDFIAKRLQSDEALDRFFMPLDNPPIEGLAIHMMDAMFKGTKAPFKIEGSERSAQKKKKKGLIGKLFGKK